MVRWFWSALFHFFLSLNILKIIQLNFPRGMVMTFARGKDNHFLFLDFRDWIFFSHIICFICDKYVDLTNRVVYPNSSIEWLYDHLGFQTSLVRRQQHSHATNAQAAACSLVACQNNINAAKVLILMFCLVYVIFSSCRAKTLKRDKKLFRLWNDTPRDRY